MDLIGIKIGGSILTDKSNAKMEVDFELLKQILEVLKLYTESNKSSKFIIGHGAGSFGHTKAKIFLDNLSNYSKEEIQEKLTEIHLNVLKLHETVKKYIYEHLRSEDVVQILFGDVCFAGPNYIESTELKFFNYLQQNNLKLKSMIFLTDQDGILHDITNPELGIIDKIQQKSELIEFGTSKDATGGMKQKLDFSFKLLKYSDKVAILNGNHPARLNQYLNGFPFIGTCIIE
jgi:isopentenyl phosphate kinase